MTCSLSLPPTQPGFTVVVHGVQYCRWQGSLVNIRAQMACSYMLQLVPPKHIPLSSLTAFIHACMSHMGHGWAMLLHRLCGNLCMLCVDALTDALSCAGPAQISRQTSTTVRSIDTIGNPPPREYNVGAPCGFGGQLLVSLTLVHLQAPPLHSILHSCTHCASA